jgi:hypothetical protein
MSDLRPERYLFSLFALSHAPQIYFPAQRSAASFPFFLCVHKKLHKRPNLYYHTIQFPALTTAANKLDASLLRIYIERFPRAAGLHHAKCTLRTPQPIGCVVDIFAAAEFCIVL